MSQFVFPPSPQPSLAVVGEAARFPIRRVFCVGRNYAAHAREMGNDERDPPFFFTKPADAVVEANGSLPYPPMTTNLHHEIELVVAIGTGGTDITADNALAHIFGYAVGVDLTRRDLQEEAKKAGRPWDWAKGFDASAPIGPIAPGAKARANGRIWLSVNDEMRQEGDLAEQIWSVPEIIATCSRSVRLQPGDLIMTGTPAGVGPILRGDVIKGGIDAIGEIEFTIK